MKLHTKETAVLSLDFQKGLVGFMPKAEEIIPTARKVLDIARKNHLQIIHVGLGFAEGHPEIPAGTSIISQIKEHNLFVKGTESAEFILAEPNELTIYKQRFSGFADNDLEMVLKVQGIKHLILMGLTTSGVVLSTLRRAADLDFSCTIIKDACFDTDEETHRVLVEKIFPAQAKVISAAEFNIDN